ncbi:MAG TPA: heparinase II/III family protein [Thermomicrobiales bacterium]|jgi:hypothetical protein|nr:heparinase II/III family protein [Thermomicrobiales bacterium]
MPTLSDLLPPDLLSDHLIPRAEWHPCPTAIERAAWDSLPEAIRADLVREAERHVDLPWSSLPATLFLRYRREGERVAYETPYFQRRGRLIDLVLGECAEGRGRFLDPITDGIWAICEESSWVLPAHNGPTGAPNPGLPPTDQPYLDLFAAETAGLLAWTHRLLADTFRSADLAVLPDRIRREIVARVLLPYRERDDWWWLGLVTPDDPTQVINNWNPWIHSNVLAASLLLDADADRVTTVGRVVAGLDAFLATYHADGGCDEGISYWRHAGGSLFECLELVSGALRRNPGLFEVPLVREIGRFVHRSHIGGPWWVNFADGSAQPRLDGRIVARYGVRIGDDVLVAMGQAMGPVSGESHGPSQPLGARLMDLLQPGPLATAAEPPLVRDSWLPGTEVLVARERARSTDGLTLAAKGGHNNESHNHNDVGTFIVALDGVPAVIDLGVGTYTRQTFGPDRYAIWTMRSPWHNLPTVDGHEQAPGAGHHARDVAATVSDGATGLTLDLALAWPGSAGIRTWRRTIRLERGDTPQVVLDDAWDLAAEPEELTLSLILNGLVTMSAGEIAVHSPGIGRPLLITWDAAVLAAEVEPVAIDDARLAPVWGDGIARVMLRAKHPAASGSWTVTMRAG